MQGVIGVTRIQVGRGALVEVEPVFMEVQAEVHKASAGAMTSLWRDEDDDHHFVQLSTIPTMEEFQKVSSHLLQSRVVEHASERLKTVPDAQQFVPLWSAKVNAETLHKANLVSVSERAMDMGYGQEWADKLSDNFREVSVIPGFAGAVVAQSIALQDTILGLGFWDISTAFQQSVPPHPHYTIKLYRRFR